MDCPLKMWKLYLTFFAFIFSLHCFTCCCALRNANLTTDEHALLAFKSSINLDTNHPVVKNWSSSTFICSWIGVTCNARHRRVGSLNLGNMNISGIIHPQLGNLSFLVELDLSSNNFHGELPDEFAKLHRLKLFNLSYNRFSGGIPNWIGDLSKLQHLIFKNNSFGGFIPTSISNLSKLESLVLNCNLINGTIPPEIGLLPCLKALIIPANKLSGTIPQTISNISSLQVLNLFDNLLSGHIPPEIGLLPQLKIMYLGYNRELSGSIPMTIFNNSGLQEIDLERCKLSGNLPSCISCGLPRLEAIYLGVNKLSGQIPRDIANLTLLQLLYLDGNNLEGSIPLEIGDLDRLEELGLGYNNLRGYVPMNIFNISTLTYLYLAESSLSGFLPSDIGQSLSNLEELHLYGNKFSGKIPSSISNASKLAEIELQDNKFSGVIPKALGKLRYLQYLDVSINNLVGNTHEMISSLKNCKFLIHLDISLNPLHGKLPKEVGNLSHSLQVFMIESSNTGGSIPIEIGNLSSLFKLSLSGNNLVGPLPFTIGKLHDLQFLNLGDNGLQGAFIDEICQMKSLGGLRLANNKFSGLIPTCLGNLTSLRYVDFSSNNFFSEIPTSVWSLTDILELNLSFNIFTGTVPIDIGKLEALTLLDLSRNKISGNIPTSIGGLKTLQSLSFAHNELKGFIPESIGYLVSLESLDLSQNYLSGEIPKSLQSLGYLKYINLSYNLLQGEIPDGGTFKNLDAKSFMFNKALCGKPRLQVPPCREIRSTAPAKLIFIKFILPVFVSIILVVSCVIILRCKIKKEGDHPAERNSWDLAMPPRISYFELLQATNRFDETNMLGCGSVGSVFKGILSSGLTVAIKVFNSELEAASRSFDVECEAMRNLRHRNLVKVISCCSNSDIKSLVMEFMPNGSLEKWLYSHNYCLSFSQRLNIMIDVASALEYLHHSFSKPVVHCDIKPSNVLLDEHMVAHVSDFGITKLLDKEQSKTHTKTLGTFGYIAPEYGTKGLVSTKGDVYSYGIMLMEVFTRKKPTNDMFVEGLNLKSWVTKSMPNAITEVMDSNMLLVEGEQHIGEITRSVLLILELALNCCTDQPEERINMTDVIASLNKINMMFMRR